MVPRNLKGIPAIQTGSIEAVGLQMVLAQAAAPTSGVWPAANDAIFVPFILPQPTLVQRLFTTNGTVASGNIDIGLYTVDGARIVSSGSTVMVGASALQFFDIADIVLGSGKYYMALALDNTTASIRRSTMGGNVLRTQEMGLVKSTSAFPLPASPTFTAMTAAYTPWIGLEVAGIF